MKKRISILALMLAVMVALVACGDKEPKPVDEPADVEDSGDAKTDEEVIKVGMVTDEGGVNDQSFNESAWMGLQEAEKNLGVEVRYMESEKDADYPPHLETLLDGGHELIWGVGYKLSQALDEAAKNNPDTFYAIVDYDYDAPSNAEFFPEGTRDNVVGLIFKDEQSSFLVGYIAGKTTESNKVGFVGGIEGDVIKKFENGYKAGVKYAAKELGKEIEVDVQYIQDFSDSSKAKATATNMYQQGADIVFHAAGGAGEGVINAAVEQDKWAIGVDRDQNDLAPDHVLTSAMKRVDVGIYNVVEEYKNGVLKGGETEVFGLEDGGAVDIAPTSDKNVAPEVLAEIDGLKEKIISGEVEVPYNDDLYEEWLSSL